MSASWMRPGTPVRISTSQSAYPHDRGSDPLDGLDMLGRRSNGAPDNGARSAAQVSRLARTRDTLSAAVWTAGATRRMSTFPAHPDAEIAATGTFSESSTALATHTTPAADFLLFVGDPVDCRPPELLSQDIRIPNCPGSHCHQSGSDRSIDHIGIRGGQQRLPHSGCVCGQPAADPGRQTRGAFAMQYLHVDHLGAVQHSKVDRLTCRFTQISHER